MWRKKTCRPPWSSGPGAGSSRRRGSPETASTPGMGTMVEISLLIHDLEAAVSPKGTGPLRGRDLGELEVHAPASIALAGDRIAAVGPPKEVLRDIGADCETVDGREIGRASCRERV